MAIGGALALNWRSRTWPAEADARVNAARKSQAEESLAQLYAKIESTPDDPAAHLELGKALADRDQLLAAAKHVEKAVTLDPTSADAHLLLGMIYAPLDYGRRAEAEYRRAIGLSPTLLEAYQRLGDVLLAGGRKAAAEAVFRSAIDRAPASAGPRLSLAAIQSDSGKNHEVLKTLEPIMASGTPSVAALYLAGKACQSIGQTKRAAELFRHALAQAPDFPDARHALGSVLCNEGKYSEGIPELEKAISLDSRNPTYHYALANALRSDRSAAENLRAARREYESTIELNPRDPFAHYYYGNVLEELGESIAAIREYERTLELEPTFSSARHRLGGLMKSLGRTAEGERHLAQFAREARKAINEVHGGRRDRSFVDTAEAHFQRAIDFLGRGDRQLARKSLEMALQRDPAHSAAARKLAELRGK